MRNIAKAIITALTALLILITGSPAAGAIHPEGHTDMGYRYVQECEMLRQSGSGI